MIVNDLAFFDHLFKDSKQNLNICLMGNTIDTTKYAYAIKTLLVSKHHKLFCVDKDYAKINDIPVAIDLLIICMHPLKALTLLQDSNKSIPYAVLQPGAESLEIHNLLKDQKTIYTDGCVLKYFDA